MSFAVEDDDSEVLHAALQCVRDDLKISLNGKIDVHLAGRGRADNELLHVDVRSMQ